MSRIFITGITGTIGRAFTDLLKEEHHVLGLDRNEASVAEFKRDYPDVDVAVGDFGDMDFFTGGLDILIHLAAMKHVDLAETNASECIRNNVIKTHDLFKRAHASQTAILFMSTDKAVEPISVYGYSKALGEAMALEYGGAIIRSGNVMSSNGSVMTIWDEQIANKLPVKVTHRDMRRYYISAENLVAQAWEMYQTGDRVIIPEMDREVGLMELLDEALAGFGYTVDDYPYGIEFIGLRAGEKLQEKLEWQK